MSLVLAVQPDGDQAARLSAVCRRIGAELVLAASAPEALAALGGRVPDVILSAPLLPASDETAVAEFLRALGDAALHVQAIGAPMLGDAIAEEPHPKGLLKAFKRPRRAALPAACDEATFAGELSGHLLRAVAERAAMTAEPIELPLPDLASAFPRSAVPTAIDDLWPQPRVTVHSDVGSGFSRTSPPAAAARVPVTQLRDGDGSEEPAEVHLKAGPTGGSRIPDPPVDIELISLVDAIAKEKRPRTRKTQAPRRRKRRVYEDAAYFDPARSEFAAVVERFDEFTRASRVG